MDSPATSLRLGTRNSALARWQSNWVAEQLRAFGIVVDLVTITTEGDVDQRPIGPLSGRGLFTSALQRALLDNQVDLAVHSLKDLPTEPVEGLALAAVPRREIAWDALVSNVASTLDQLPAGARLGTGSMRRRAQLLSRRPDIEISNIRGNVDTRLRKLDNGEFDAIVLAEAGLRRLDLVARVTQRLSAEIMLPAVGQGALGLETRSDDGPTRSALASLNDLPTYQSVSAERSMLATLMGGCLAPVGGLAEADSSGQLTLRGVVLSADGRKRVSAAESGHVEQAREIGVNVAQNLLAQGASECIESARQEHS